MVLRKLLIYTLTAVLMTGTFVPGGRWQVSGSDGAFSASNAVSHAAALGTLGIMKCIADLDTEAYLRAKEYPEGLIELYVHHPESGDFVLQYFEKKDTHVAYDLSADVIAGQIPHLLQWDARWGYEMYYDEIMALSGCGPMALAMVGLGLTGDTEKFDPLHVAQFSAEMGYYVYGAGTSWLLFRDGAKELGLTVFDVEPTVEDIASSIREGRPVICSMGPGDFTESGHFIVLWDAADDGTVAVMDPVSISRTGRRWDLASLVPQIKMLWGYSA